MQTPLPLEEKYGFFHMVKIVFIHLLDSCFYYDGILLYKFFNSKFVGLSQSCGLTLKACINIFNLEHPNRHLQLVLLLLVIPGDRKEGGRGAWVVRDFCVEDTYP